MVLSLRESDDEFSPEDIEALMKINRSLMKINETLDRMEASSRKHSDDFERRMTNLEKKLGYTWSPQPTPMEPSQTANPVKPVIYPHEPSKENALNEDVVMDVDDERATEKSQSDMSTLEYLKLNTTHSDDACSNLKVSHTDPTLKTLHVDVVKRGARASSHVRNTNSSLCTPGVCENVHETSCVISNKDSHCFESISILCMAVGLRRVELWFEKPPSWPPDAYRDLPRLLEEVDYGQKGINTLLSLDETYADISLVRISKNLVSAFVSIMRRCNNMCSFCIVPFTRGREQTHPVDSIVREVGELWHQGVKEVMLLGQKVNSYNYASGVEKEVEPGTKWELSEGFSSKCKVKEGICELNLLWTRVGTKHDIQGGQLVYSVINQATSERVATKMMVILLLNVLKVTRLYLLSLRTRPLLHQVATDRKGKISQSVEFEKSMRQED